MSRKSTVYISKEDKELLQKYCEEIGKILEKYPYSNPEYEQNVLMLINLEIMETYEIINYIGWCLGENIDYMKIDNIFKDYGFYLNNYKLDLYG